MSIDVAIIDDLFAGRAGEDAPGFAAGILHGDEVVYRRAFGRANLELQAQLSPGRRMRIASVSKQMTCLAFMLLYEEGRCSPDELVRDHLPELRGIAEPIRVRHLMTHTSGLLDAHDLRFRLGGMARETRSAAILDCYRATTSLNFPPGSSWRYNNGAFLALTAIIERIAGAPLENVFRDRIFEPLGMADSLLARSTHGFVDNSAASHMIDPDGHFIKATTPGDLAGEGGVVSTLDDLLRWLDNMLHPKVGSAVSWAEIRTPFVLTNGFPTGYGLGLFAGRLRGHDALWHGGAVWGSNAHIVAFPSLDLAIAVLSNRHDLVSANLIDQLLDRLLPPRVTRSAPAWPGLLGPGTYRSAAGRVMQVAPPREQSEMQVALDGTGFLFEPGPKPGLWVIKDGTTTGQALICAVPDQPGLTLTEFGQPIRFVRLEGAQADPVGALAGSYGASVADARISISIAGDGTARLLCDSAFGCTSYDLEPLASGVFIARSPDSLTSSFLLTVETPDHIRLFSYGNSGIDFIRAGLSAANTS